MTMLQANTITIHSVKHYAGDRSIGVQPRVVTRFADADGTRYLHVGSPRYFDIDGNACKRAGAALICGAAVLTENNTIDVYDNGTSYHPDGNAIIAKLSPVKTSRAGRWTWPACTPRAEHRSLAPHTR